MRVIISAGGTGGHIYPALAILNKIKEVEPSSEFLYIGTKNRMEKDIVPENNIPFKGIDVYGFNSKNIFKNFHVIKLLLKAEKECKKIIKDFNPDIVIGVGGYVTTPVITAAKKLGYPTIIHEQNSVPGKANLFLTKYADLVAVSFASSASFFPKEKVVITGNPCSENALKVVASNKEDFGLNLDKKLVLIVMGSLGSSKMNDFFVGIMDGFKNKEYEIVFVTGKDGYEEIDKNNFPDNVKVFPYIENMTSLLKKTDVIISRAGASTLSEIIALKIPSILIPSPYVPNNHQYKNALDLVENKACILIEEENLNKKILIDAVDSIINDDKLSLDLKINLSKLDTGNSATIIYENIKKLVSEK